MSDDFEKDDQEEFHFRWQIKNFSYSAQKIGEAIESPNIPVDFLDETTWQLLVYPRGKFNEEDVSVYLKRVDDDSLITEVDLIVFIELEAADSSRVKRQKITASAMKKNQTKGFINYIERNVLFRAKKSIWLPDDILTLHCTFQKPVQVNEDIDKYAAETTHETIKSEFTWTLENYSMSGSVRFYNEVIFTGGTKGSFFITIYDSAEYVDSLILQMQMRKPKRQAFVTCFIGILDKKGDQVLNRSTGHYFRDGTETTSYTLYNRKEIKYSHLQNGNLRLQCAFYMYTGKIAYSIPKLKHERQKIEKDLEDGGYKELVKDYENLYLNGTLSDVQIRADGRTVNCHKTLLRARSPILSDLLDKAELNSVDDPIDVDDLDGDTLERLIYFLYSDKINGINVATALKLFVAGHNYQIGYLQEQCSYYLKTHFSFENVCDVLIAAHHFEAADLKRDAIRYISEYFSRVCLTAQWQNFRNTEKKLASDTCRCIRRLKNV